MLTTFVIGLREGVEAALIVGIIASVLRRDGDRRAFRAMWAGVALAVLLCIGVAVGLRVAGSQLPFRSREIMEGILTLVAAAGVLYMVAWMRRHAHELKPELEEKTADALRDGSTWALVGLAFFAVIREGLETAIFLVALVGGTANPVVGLTGGLLGILTAVAIGWGIYRGGLRFDLRRFFRVTGVVLVVLAAGLVASAVHSFAEAGLIGFWQAPAVDLSAILAPGTVRAALLTAFLGLQPVPTYLELAVWIAFLVPALVFVLSPPPNRPTEVVTP